jgi:hypothetical protein
MSEYQYYEWQTIDRPLTAAERKEVDRLSSHITVTATGAWVDYNWGNFKHDPIQVLVNYFDAFLYLANWGSKQLAFRFPKDLLDPWPLQPYIIEPYIMLETFGDYQVLSFDLSPEEPDVDWIEGAGWLGTLASLRADILGGDYRALYLAWLRAVELYSPYEIAEDEPEPPLPPGMKRLSSALQTLVEFFNIEGQLLAAAAEASPDPQETPTIDWANAIAQLSRAECDDFLLRLARGEPHLSLGLQRRLQALLPQTGPQPIPPQRTVADLLAMQKIRIKTEKQRQAEAARRRRQQELDDLERREAQVWPQIEQLIEAGKSEAYDEVTKTLVNLRELAERRKTQAEFQARVTDLAERYRRKRSLIDRLQRSRLI